MKPRYPLGFVVLLFSVAITAGSQEQHDKTIEHVPIKPTSAASGQEMYTSYCAVCHGKDGKGGGPAADEPLLSTGGERLHESALFQIYNLRLSVISLHLSP